jgi:hypothetical protein
MAPSIGYMSPKKWCNWCEFPVVSIVLWSWARYVFISLAECEQRPEKNSTGISCSDTHVPSIEVLWWMLFQTTQFSFPVVTDRSIVKTSPASKALFSKPQTSRPSGLAGRYAVRRVPLYDWPGLGWSLCKIELVIVDCQIKIGNEIRECEAERLTHSKHYSWFNTSEPRTSHLTNKYDEFYQHFVEAFNYWKFDFSMQVHHALT